MRTRSGRPRLALLANASKGHTTRWARYFADRGWDVMVFSFEPASIDGVTVVELPGAGVPWRYATALPVLRRMLAEFGPDIFHAHYASGYGLLARLVDRHPCVLSVWGSDVYEFPRRSPLHRALLRGNLAAADHLCSTSRDMARETALYTDKAITVTPFGVDCDVYAPGERIEGGPTIVGTVKTLEPSYGIDTLIQAFARVRAARPALDARLVIAGGGSSRQDLEHLAVDLGVGDRVTFLGEIEQRRVPEILRTFSVFVALSRRESFGVALLEASACGIPLVATAVGGLPEVVEDGVTGYLVPPDDPAAAAEAIERIIASPALGARLGAAGREFVLSRYRWTDNATIMERLYSRILASPVAEAARDGDRVRRR